MTNKIIAVLVIIVVGFGVYLNTHLELLNKNTVTESGSISTQAEQGKQTAPGDHPEEDHTATDGVPLNQKSSISWRSTVAGEQDGVPYTNVTVLINNKAYEVGKFQGSCSEVGANGGIDGKGLLIGELSAVQCWFAGGGDEIGVFAHEDGGFDVMVGELGEGEEGSAFFRGKFKIKLSISI